MTEEEKGSDVTVTVTSGCFPAELFREWDEDCKKKFGNCRWMKMWFDHLVASRLSKIEKNIEKLEVDIRNAKTDIKPV